MKFDSPAVLSAKIRLCCVDACDVSGVVIAYVEGITAGELTCSQAFAAGDFLDIPIRYFPHVSLPAKMRFVLGEVDIAEPLTIAGLEDVMTLLGHGHIHVGPLSLENSLLRGTIVNTSNSVNAASAFIKINGHVVRSAVVEPARGRDEGGSSARFAVPIRPGDFVESGLSIDLFVMGVDYPVAHFTYLRSDPDTQSRRLIEIDEKLRQMQKSTLLQIEMLRDSLEHRLTVQQERMDTFVEYAMSLIVDKLAGPLEALNPADFLDALRHLGTSNGSVALPVSMPPSTASLALDAPALSFGWYDVETNGDGDFRWMGQTGLIRNPYTSRPLSRLELTVSQVYGASEPMLRATLDDQELSASVKKNGKVYLVNFTAPADRKLTGESMHLESFVTGCPAVDHGNTDERILSIAVTHVKIYYEAITEVAA
jgi:hypothetical protein